MLECVVNVSEGHSGGVIDEIAAAAGTSLLDVHTDEHHNRSVLTIAGADVGRAARDLTRVAVLRLDLRAHRGVHPRLGVVDVVPFVPLAGSSMADAIDARDAFASWVAEELAVPCFLYGPERSLPEIRRGAFSTLRPDVGPLAPHPSAGACCVGARPLLVAYNVWLAPGTPLRVAREVAAAVRGPHVRALGLAVGDQVQVSMNLIDPLVLGPGAAFDEVANRVAVARAELVGLVPAAALEAVAEDRWRTLDLDPSRTIEARLRKAGLDGGRFAPG